MTALAPPPANPELLGHGEAEAAMLRAWQTGRLAHAWLITGPRGIGKATFAYRLARFVLAGGEAVAPTSLAIAPESPVFRRVAAGAHANLRILEPTPHPKSGRMRDEIVVDQIRDLAPFLHLTEAEADHWRVIIVDSADMLNRSAANALLKALEEPSAEVLFLLVSHAESRLLPTVRSRCHRLALRPLDDAVMTAILARAGHQGEAASMAIALAGGSAGRALRLAAMDGPALYRNLLEVAAAGPPASLERILEMASPLARKTDQGRERFALMIDVIAILFARLAGWAAGVPARGAVVADEAALNRRLLGRRELAQWLALWEKIARHAGRVELARLDRRQVAIAALTAIAS